MILFKPSIVSSRKLQISVLFLLITFVVWVFIGFLYRKLVEFSICCIYLFKKIQSFFSFCRSSYCLQIARWFYSVSPLLSKLFFSGLVVQLENAWKTSSKHFIKHSKHGIKFCYLKIIKCNDINWIFFLLRDTSLKGKHSCTVFKRILGNNKKLVWNISLPSRCFLWLTERFLCFHPHSLKYLLLLTCQYNSLKWQKVAAKQLSPC